MGVAVAVHYSGGVVVAVAVEIGADVRVPLVGLGAVEGRAEGLEVLMVVALGDPQVVAVATVHLAGRGCSSLGAVPVTLT